MEHQFFAEYGPVIIKLSVAMLLGMIIGVERIFAHKTAGMRTYALVSMGSALFIIISELIAVQYAGLPGLNPALMAGQIITGIGFLGVGLMIHKGGTVLGLTTATGLWVSAGIGMAVGFGFFILALIATILTLFIFIALWVIEDRIRKYTGEENEAELHDEKIS